jgi:lipoprotein-anchoring transpeptidase ErfK/SrfK
MKRFWIITAILAAAILPVSPVMAQNAGQGGDVTFGLPLCLPGMPADGTCLPMGPAQTVMDMKTAGFPYPSFDLPAASPPSELNTLPVYVAKINLDETEPAPVYGSAGDAAAGVNPIGQIPAGSLRYISYITRADIDGNPYLQLASGGWLRASPASYTNFQGLVFFENPHNDFGWVIDQTESYREPSFSAQTTGKKYYQADVIQVYNRVEAEGVTWFEIGLNEWVNSMKARAVTLDLTPPGGVEGDRWIAIDVYTFGQTLTVYDNGQLQFATLIASGYEPYYTRPGVFQIYEKKPLETMQGSFESDRSDFYYLQDVPWTMYFDEARALHATYWHTLFGYTQSHGCVNLSPGDAQWLYNWAEVGDYVYVYDPSGQTPTDDSSYGPGAP